MAKKNQKKQKKQAADEETESEVQLAAINPKDLNSFYAWDGEILILNVLGTPSAKNDMIGKVKGTQLKVSVREAPRGGKATDYMVRFLADEFDVSIKDIQVVSGRFNVNKQFRIKSPKKLPAEILREEIPVKDESSVRKHKKQS
jgi:uncharacterized protein (TIGR00251 family)